MSRAYRFLFSVFIVVFFIGCGSSGNTGANSVGNNLVSAEVIDEVDASVMLSIVQANIDPTAANAFGYKAVKIVYNTTNIQGNSIEASGILVIPEATDAYKSYLASLGKSFSISSICDNHGTIFLNSEAPSMVEVSDGIPNLDLAVLMSGYAGFATIMPDYLGYGDSKGETHPYIMTKSAEASLDMIRASMRYMIDNGYMVNGQLYVSGYSEGGYVAMALAKEIEEEYSSEFELKGIAPMAGPYDVEGLASYELNASKRMMYPAFLAYIADSYSKAYDDINIEDLVVHPEIFQGVDLFGGDYDAVPIHAYLGLADIENGDYGFGTHYANELFKDSFLDDYHTNPQNSAKLRFEENGVYNWTPQAKINLIHCVDDEIIPYSISTQKAYDTLSANGAVSVSVMPIPSSMIPAATATEPFVHQRCAPVAYGAAVSWFNDIRSGVIQ